MPDLAVEAAKWGLPYTEPTTKGLFKSQPKLSRSVECVADPNNPFAAPRPRRVFDTTTGGGGFWKKKSSPANPFAMPQHPSFANFNMPTHPTFEAFNQPQLVNTYTGQPQFPPWSFSPPPAPPIPNYRPLPIPTPGAPSTTATSPPNFPIVPMQPTPLPDNFLDLPKSERKYLKKVHEQQLKSIKDLQKAAIDHMKAEAAEKKLKEEMERKKKKEEMRAAAKQLKWLQKHPERPLPFPSFPGPIEPKVEPKPKPQDPMSFMMLPTLEEFGVRRPLDAPGRPGALGGPESGAWPMMSRTMTHALTDMSREERVHMRQAGLGYAPHW